MNAERFEFNRVTFALPTQTFKVTAFISTEERLPAVTEFVLRLLHTCGQVSLAALRDYFGFSEAEALSVIESLDRHGYVKLVDDALTLSEEIAARFDASPDNCPWVTKLKKRTDIVPFDLLAFTALRRSEFTYATDNWVKLNPAVDVVGNSVERARRAYRESFVQIERESARSRGEERERSYGVHSIESVEARKPSFLPVTVGLGVNRNNVFSLRFPEEFESGANSELFAEFRERVSNELDGVSKGGAEKIDEFIDLFHLDFLRQYVTGGNLDIGRYAENVRSGMAAPKDIQPIFGSSYLKGNRESISALIHEARQGFRGAPIHLASLVWLAPDYAHWGRGDDFRAAVELLGRSLKTGGGGDNLYILDYAQERQEVLVRSKYSGTGLNELHLLRPGGFSVAPLMSSLELMLYPGQFVVALLHLPIDGVGGVRAPIGIISKRTKHLHLVHRLIEDSGAGNLYAGRWPPKKEAIPTKQPRTLSEGCYCLAYSDFSADDGLESPKKS